MAVQIEPGISLPAGLRQAILYEVSGASRRLQTGVHVSDVELHEARKHIKRARALLRLAPRTIAHDETQAELRGAAHALGPAREEVAELESIRKLAASALGAELWQPLLELTERLSAARHFPSGSVPLAGATSTALVDLERATQRLLGWAPHKQGFSGIAEGLRASYRRGRQALERALAERSGENLHTLRRHAKCHFYQLSWLMPLWPAELDARRDELDELTSALGEHHDLALLAPSIGERLSLATTSDDQRLAVRLSERLEELALTALPIARRLFAERARAFVARHAEYFAIWDG